MFFFNINQPEILHLFEIDSTWRYYIRPSNLKGSLEIMQVFFRKIVKNQTLETENLDKQTKHRSLILMRYRSITLSKASILFPGEMFTS